MFVWRTENGEQKKLDQQSKKQVKFIYNKIEIEIAMWLNKNIKKLDFKLIKYLVI